MARYLANRRPIRLRVPSTLDGLAPEFLTFFKPSKGINTQQRLTEIGREFSPELINVFLDRDGNLNSRVPVSTVGEAATDPLMHAFEFKTASGTVVRARFTTTKMQTFDGASWSDVPGATFTGTTTHYFTVTAFGQYLLFSNGLDGLFQYDPSIGSITQITTSAYVPAAQHITTFANRVIATNVIDIDGENVTRLRWSAKNDHTKWDPTVDLGSGFEDVTSSPHPDVDVVQATYPITDELALIFRKRSVWLMSLTGIADAPFRFSLLYDQVGTEAPYSLVPVPGGILGYFDYDMLLVNHQQISSVGDLIIDELVRKIVTPRELFGGFNPLTLEYRLVVKEDNAIWRYPMRSKGWTRDVYPFTPKTVSQVSRSVVGTVVIDDLVGFIDDLEGTIDELGATEVIQGGVYITQAGDGGMFVVREDPSSTQDVDDTGAAADSPIEIRTGMILPGSPIEKVEILEVQLEYEALEAQDLTFEYSDDGGVTWNNYSTISVAVTSQPETLSVRRTVAAKRLQVRMTSNTIGKLLILGMHVSATKGARLHP